MKTIKELMEWRFACKHFDQNKQIPEAELREILEAARLAPSSNGLQAWRFIVVTNQELRQKLLPACYNQAQITEASALVFFCARTDLLGEKGIINRWVEYTKKEQGRSDEESVKYKAYLESGVVRKNDSEVLNWVQKQVYIPAEVLILAAAEKGIDSCPMEGFIPAEVAKVLELPEYLTPTVLVSLGYRNMEQPKKVRFSFEEVVEFRN